jgi:hypothetical protein
MERVVSLVNRGGRSGLIVPVSFASAGAFDSLRHVICNRRTIWSAHFSNRPGKLFEGAQNRLTIVIASPEVNQAKLFSTNYFRWNARGGERDGLFPKLFFGDISSLARSFHGLLPKIGTVEGLTVLSTVFTKHTLREYTLKSRNHPVYWVRVPGYFCQFFLSPPKARPEKGGPERDRGELLSVSTRSYRLQRVLHAILNSTTYYLFYCIYTDGRHINPSDVYDFPLHLDNYSEQTLSKLEQLSISLEQCMITNTSKWRKSELLIDSVNSAACKHILDQTDITLAQHYGFTDEELDFIINYDIKYRMGRDDGEEEG